MSSSSSSQRRGGAAGGGRGRPPPQPTGRGCGAVAPAGAAPCGACKFLRRKCAAGCVFAPHFATEQGAAKFAAVHRVFGASNVSKLLLRLPAAHHHDAVVTVCYEAQARLADPVYGCVATVLALQQQVAALQAELSVVQGQLISSRLAVANALHRSNDGSIALVQPSYSNASSTSNELTAFARFQSRYDNNAEATATASLPPPLPPAPSRVGFSEEEEEEEEESRRPLIGVEDIFQQRE